MGSHKPSESFIADFETNCIRCISSLSTCQVGNNKRKCERESEASWKEGTGINQESIKECRVKAIIEFDYLPAALPVKMHCH